MQLSSRIKHLSVWLASAPQQTETVGYAAKVGIDNQRKEWLLR
jgi:hypothetical protein